MRKKKDLPLVILQALEPYVGLKGDKFEVVDPGEGLLKIIDRDQNSTFHFMIEKYQQDKNSRYHFLMNRIPKSAHDNGAYKSWVEISDLQGQLDAWIKLLNEYETTPSFFDDPITTAYQQEFYSEFELIDEDAENNPFKTSQILLLDEYLESVGNKLSEMTNMENAEEIKDIQSDIVLLRVNLTARSKKWVVTALTKIWAKIAKRGVQFIREFLTATKKELIKQGVKELITIVKENGSDVLS